MVFGVLACGLLIQQPTPPAGPAATLARPATIQASPTLSPTMEPARDDFIEGERANVIDVIDGDTIDVNLNGAAYRVRYIGIDTPERGEPFFSEATEANRTLVEGQTVIMVKDVSETDRFGRLLRYVYLEDGTFVNAKLVQDGYAVVATFPPDVRHQELFLELQREARETSRGLWDQRTTLQTQEPLSTQAPLPMATNPDSPDESNCDPSYPDFCIPPPPPDLDCGDIPQKNFTVLPPDPHRFDGDNDGIGCES